jgi:hypothetical protein
MDLPFRTYGVNLKSGDGYTPIQFSVDGTTDNGSIKVDTGENMIISSIDNFYVKRNGSDRLAITDTNSDLMASDDVTIQSNKTGSTYTWTFENNGNLTTPGGLISSIQEITTNTAVSLTTLITTFNTTGGSLSSTLSDGTEGQIKILAARLISAGTTAVLTPTTAIGYSSLSFNESGDSATLLYTSSGWIVINERNVSFN